MGVIFSQGSGVADSIFGKSQDPIHAIIEQGVEAFEQNSQLANIFSMTSSTNYAEKYTTETSVGDFTDVGENGAYPSSSIQEGYSKTIEPTTWKNQLEVTQEMIEDAKMGKIKSRAKIFTTSYGRTREKFGAAMLAGGIGSSVTINGKAYDTTSADGVAFFSKLHPSKTGKKSTQSNIFTAAFGTSILDAVQEKMQDFTDDDGNLLNVSPDTIIIPNSAVLKRAVLAAVGSDLDPNTNNNALNFQAGLWNVRVWPYLPKTMNGQPYFILMDSVFNTDYECLPWIDRVPLTVKSDIDPNTDANIFKGRARFGAGFNNWRCMAICGAGLTGTALS